MPIYSAQFPKFQITAPRGWHDATEQDQHASIGLDRELAYAKIRGGPGYGGHLSVQAERMPKGFETRTTSKALLKILLDKGKANKWGEPYEIVCEEKPLRLASVSFTFRYDKYDFTQHLRVWRVVKGRIAIYAAFSPDSFYVTSEETALLFDECESIVRSVEDL